MSEAPADPPKRSEPEAPAERTIALQAQLTPGHTLPPGTRIHDYRIDRVIGEGGFGIVYLATDVALERQVAIKEYLPASMAARAGQSLTVVVKSPSHEETFSIGLRSFVNEAKLLARFDHPALLKVHQFWEANGTAYMAMPYYQGPTLKDALAKLGRLPSEAEVRAWLMPLLDALEVLHDAQCYHRDIAPDNILLTDNGPLLLDFGAARRVIGDLTHALTAMLKPGFAPIEQYGEMPGVTQGPWTDIFALASVLYAAISGRRTVAAVERLLVDQLRPLATVAAGRCGRAFLAAIDVALAIHPKDRPQSIAEFRALLTVDDTQALDLLQLRALGGVSPEDKTVLLPDFDPTQSAAAATLLMPRDPAPLPPPPPPAPRPPAPTPPIVARPAVAPAAPVPAPVLVPPALAPKLSPAAPVPIPATPTRPAPRPSPGAAAAKPPAPRRALVLTLAGAAGLAAAAWGGYRLLSSPAPAPLQPAASEVPASAPAVSVMEAASAASAPDTIASAAPPPAAPASAPAPVPTPAPPPPAPAPTAAPPAAPKPRPAVLPAAPSITKGEKCSDILQKASLEPLSASETAYLKKECR